MDIRESWIDLLHRAATGSRKTRTLLTPVGATIFGLFTALFIMVSVWELRRIEEPELVMRFGDTYIEYRSRTPMFVPLLAPMRR